MLLNNLKIAIRSLLKRKTYTIINVIGLSIGIAAVLLIYRMVSYELSFNQSFKNHERIVRVVSGTEAEVATNEDSPCVPIPAMLEMQDKISHFELTSRVRESWGSVNVRPENSLNPVEKIGIDNQEIGFFVEPAFVKIFDFDWLGGNPKTALKEPGSIVLTKSWAERAFGKWEDAMGRLIYLDNLIPCKVNGVIDALPPNTDFPIVYLVSYETLRKNANLYDFREDSWGGCSSNNQFFALLKDRNDLDDVNKQLAMIGREIYDARSQQYKRVHLAQPLSDLHYSQRFSHSGSHYISRTRLWVLAFIGMLILFMACFNFINLTTAQSTLRAREVGVRKTLGSQKSQLIKQFISETGVIVLIALVIGVTLASLNSSFLKYISYVPNELPFITNPILWLFIIGIALLITLIAGLYPAISLANYRPAQALNDLNNQGLNNRALLRKGLIVLQFVIAQGLIIGAIVTILQLDYIRSKDLGFSKDLVYTLFYNNDSLTIARQGLLKNRLLQIPEVESVSLSSDQPLSNNTWESNFSYDTRPEDEMFDISMKFGDEDYLETYGLQLKAGRWFNKSDTLNEIVVNATLLEKLNVSDANEAVGKTILLGRSTRLPIVGVIEDFHMRSFHDDHLPLFIGSSKKDYSDAGIKIKSGSDLGLAVKAIGNVFNETLPEQILYDGFLDEDIVRMYEDDTRLSNTSKGFGLIAIIISCLGLLGLTAHATTQRIKEIGIRKVLGASVVSIIGLLSKDFLKLVVIALFFSIPIAWYLMHSWLANFAYKVNLSWWIFAVTGILAVLIALATVSLQSIKAAITNPVNSLRNE